ncbi:MAG: hypothetical protein HY904_17325 [Deltaproteobacteria bacterium]|nr:hypothetical protein [Deltaproteobacteria bacterium]
MRGPILVVLAAAACTSPATGGDPADAGHASSSAAASSSSHAPGSSQPAASSAGAGSSAASPSSGGVDCAGCITARADLGAYSVADLRPYVAANTVLDNGYSVHLVTYRTEAGTARVTVTVPLGVAAPAGGWHVVVNNPGTAGLDDPCAVGNSVAGAGLAGSFGARGFIGAAVDYPGLGTPGTHPYLVSRVEGTASLDAARAVLRLAADLGVPVSGRVALVGLSQGGHATFAAAALHGSYAPTLDVRAFAACGPASLFLEHWSAGVTVPGAHQAYHAMLVYAFNAFYAPSSSPEQLWTTDVAARIDNLMATRCPFANSGPTLISELGTDPAAIFNADFLQAYGTGDLAAYPSIQTAFNVNRVRPYTQTAPLRIYQGTADETVLVGGTRELVAALRAGGNVVDYVEVEGGGHTDVAFGFIAYPQLRTEDSISWLRERLGN